MKIDIVYRSIDPGIAHPTVCLWLGVDMKAREVLVMQEYVQQNKTVREHCSVIQRMSHGMNLGWTVIDPSANQRSKETGRALLFEFQRYGIHCIPGDNKERGIDIVKNYLKYGIVKIKPHCKTLIYELQNLQWGDKEGDDATDALRYGLVRIHDTVIGMKKVENRDSNFIDLESLAPREVSLFDKRIFPDAPSKDRCEWLYEEVA